jgi:putative chitinase
MINRKHFFSAVRAHFGPLQQGAVEGFTRILDEWERRAFTDIRWLAYMLATCWHETAKTMQPVREMGGEKYLRGKKYYPWVGEGLVQVTWEANHRKFGATAPGQLLTWEKALPALFDGMTKGMFTGKKLAQYFSAKIDDPVNARRIINGLDRAALVAGHHRAFLEALTAPAEATAAAP